jgi:hypothetical protein
VIAIALIVHGIVCLCRKRIPYGKRRELRGPLVILVCLLMIVPSSIFIGWGVMEGIEAAQNNRELDQDKLIKFTLMIELPSYAGILLLSWLIVATNAGPVRSRRRYEDDDYDDDDRDRRYRSDDYDDRPRYRGRDDDYDGRPRRRDDDYDYGDRDRDRKRPRRDDD